MNKSRVVIIAEAGVNHNGDLEIAKKLVDVAVDAGADFVKFQTFKAENLVTATAKMAEYQIENLMEEDTQFSMLKKLELSEDMHYELYRYCISKGIYFLSTGFDIDSLKFLKQFKLNLWKVPSGEITNLPYLEYIGNLNDSVVLSTGMANLQEVKDAISVLVKSGTNIRNITVLHCTTDYPTSFEDVNLNVLHTLRQELGVEVGYSDHTIGIEVSIAAVALGATVIEKHFTLNRDLPGPDHKASITPDELKMLVRQVRNIEKAMGGFVKTPSEREKKNITIARKSVVAKKKISKGELFSDENLAAKRPGSGISPMKWYEIIGTQAIKDYEKDDLI